MGQFALPGNLQNLFLEDLIYGGLGEWISTQWPNSKVLDPSNNMLESSVPKANLWHPRLVIVGLLHGKSVLAPLIPFLRWKMRSPLFVFTGDPVER
jgi:hypothetical protein